MVIFDTKDIRVTLKTVGKNIIRLRGTLGFNQDDLAKKAGVSRSTISKIENGISVEFDHLLLIAKALGVNPADLFISEEDRKEITYKAKLLLDKISKSLD